MRFQSGFTLIEIMMVMVILASAHLTLSYVYEQQEKIGQYQRVSEVAKIAGKAAEQYYRSHCDAVPFIQPTESILVAERFINNKAELSKALGDEFSFNIVTSVGNEVAINVSSDFKSNAIAKQASKYHANATATANTVTWVFTPNYKSNSNNIIMSQVATAFGTPTC